MNVLSLFDGISSGNLALQRVGIKYNNYFASEIDERAIKVAQHHFPNTIQLGDVRNIASNMSFDLLIGGSPCQGFAFCGNMKGMITKENMTITTLDQYLKLKQEGYEFHGQSYLFWEYVRLLRSCNPRYFLLENVVMHKKWERVITETLAVEPILINSSMVSAQHRRRLYWTNIPQKSVLENKSLKLKDILLDIPEDSPYNITENLSTKVKGKTSLKKALANIRTPEELAKPLTVSGQRVSNTSATNVKIRDDYIRKLTPEECELLQTVPVGYTNLGFRDSVRYSLLGNGWTVDVVAHIMQGLK